MFDEAFEKLKTMKECLALEFTDSSAEPIFFFEHQNGLGIKKISKEMNEILLGVHKLSKDLTLGSIDLIQVDSDKYTMFSACSGEEERIHIHLFVVFSSSANVALAKIAIKEALEKTIEIAQG